MSPRPPAATREPRTPAALRSTRRTPPKTPQPAGGDWLSIRRRTLERLLDDYPGEHPPVRHLDTVFRPGRASYGPDWRR